MSAAADHQVFWFTRTARAAGVSVQRDANDITFALHEGEGAGNRETSRRGLKSFTAVTGQVNGPANLLSRIGTVATSPYQPGREHDRDRFQNSKSRKSAGLRIPRLPRCSIKIVRASQRSYSSP
jgi:hypothetical protein